MFAGVRATHDDRRPAGRPIPQQVVVERVERLAQFQHDVIGDIHDVVDRPHPGASQPLLHPLGRRPDLHPLDQCRGIAQAQVGVADHDAGEVGVGDPRGGQVVRGRRVPQGLPGQRGDLTRDPDGALQVAERALDVELQDRVAQVVGQRHADRRIGGQDEDPLVFVAQVKLLLGANHALRHDPADFTGLQGSDLAFGAVAVNQPRADDGERDLRPAAAAQVLPDIAVKVRRACDHGQRLGRAVFDARQHQPIGVGVARDREDLTDEELVALPHRADLADRIHLQPGQSQPLRQLFHRQGDINIVFQPVKRNLHGVISWHVLRSA